MLKGAHFDETLVSRTIEGIAIQPVYGQVDGPRVARDIHAPWTVMQRVDHRSAAKTNEQALADLEGGANGLVLNIQDTPSARGFGLEDATTRTIVRALKDVRIDAIALRLDAGPHGRQAAQSCAEFIRSSAVNPALLAVLELAMCRALSLGEAVRRPDVAWPGQTFRAGAAATRAWLAATIRSTQVSKPIAVESIIRWYRLGSSPSTPYAWRTYLLRAVSSAR